MEIGETDTSDSPSLPPPHSRGLYRLHQIYDIIRNEVSGSCGLKNLTHAAAAVDSHLHAELSSMMTAINTCLGIKGKHEGEKEADCVARLRGYDVEVRTSGLVGGGRGVFVSSPLPRTTVKTTARTTADLPQPCAPRERSDGVIPAGSIVCLFAGTTMSSWQHFKSCLGSPLSSSSYYKDNEYMMDRNSIDGTCVDGKIVTRRKTSLEGDGGSDSSFSGSLVNHPSTSSETNATFYHSMLFLPSGTKEAMQGHQFKTSTAPPPPFPPPSTCRECITLVLALRDLMPGEEVFIDYGLASDQGSKKDLPSWYKPVVYPEAFKIFTRSEAPEPTE